MNSADTYLTALADGAIAGKGFVDSHNDGEREIERVKKYAADRADRSAIRAFALCEIDMLVSCNDCTADYMRQELTRILSNCKTRLDELKPEVMRDSQGN